MKTIEEKAEAYADRPTTAKTWGMSRIVIEDAYIAGAKEALAGQWRNVEDELPKAEQDVFVAVTWGNGYTFGYAWLSTLSNGTLRWYSHDDYLHLDDIRYWMPIPKLKDESE